jgi:hypothetical protein
VTAIGLAVAIPAGPADVRRAAEASLGRWRAQAAALGVSFVDPDRAKTVLTIAEPEAVVHPRAFEAALAAPGPSVVPVRPAELYAALWEFEEITAGGDAWNPAPATLVRGPGRPEAACGFLAHSFAGRGSHPRPEVAALVPKDAARILEIGCAEGMLGADLEAGGARVTGIEPDVRAATVAATRLSRVVAEPLESALPRLGETFDVAVAADVLEHLEDPVAALRALRDLSPTLVFSVPNGAHVSVLAGILQGRWDPALEGIVAFSHRTYAGRAGWDTLLRAGGWRVETWRPVSLLPPPAEPWLPAFELPPEELQAGQWLGVARRSVPGPAPALGPVPKPDEALPSVVANPLVAAGPLFSGDVVRDRAPLVHAVTRKGSPGRLAEAGGRSAAPRAAVRARALGLPVAWEDLEVGAWMIDRMGNTLPGAG